MEETSVTPIQRNSRAKALGFIALAIVGTLVASYAVFNNLPAQAELVTLEYDSDSIELGDLYKRWKTEYGHSFDSQEDAKRLEIFRNTDKKIREHNAGNHSYTMGHNGFSHLTDEEFTAIYYSAGFQHKKALDRHSNNTTPRILASPPTSVDWRSKGAVTPVKSLAGCAASWAFSATGALESYAFSKTKRLPNLSEQQLIDCAGAKYGNHGCLGGSMDGAWEYVAEIKGLQSGSTYPYNRVAGRCKAVYALDALKVPITGTKYVAANNSAAMMEAIALQPVSAFISFETLNRYRSGIIGTNARCGPEANHAVLIVGYNQAASPEAPNGYYIVKNSWGDWWGEKGYCRIAITGNDAGVCGLQQFGMYPY